MCDATDRILTFTGENSGKWSKDDAACGMEIDVWTTHSWFKIFRNLIVTSLNILTGF